MSDYVDGYWEMYGYNEKVTFVKDGDSRLKMENILGGAHREPPPSDMIWL